ncbi:MAG TPA: DinB family protein [Longimicrobium sp.]
MTTTAAAPVVERPAPDEHAPYYSKYTDLVPDGDVVEHMDRQARETIAFLRGIPSDLHDHRYAEGKWSIKEVIGHIADAERIFAYRALRIARGDQTPLASFDENLYVPAGEFGARAYGSLVDELESVRRATLAFFRSLTPEQARRRGVASSNEVSVRAIAYIIAGHVDHHVRILRERYLGQS